MKRLQTKLHFNVKIRRHIVPVYWDFFSSTSFLHFLPCAVDICLLLSVHQSVSRAILQTLCMGNVLLSTHIHRQWSFEKSVFFSSFFYRLKNQIQFAPQFPAKTQGVQRMIDNLTSVKHTYTLYPNHICLYHIFLVSATLLNPSTVAKVTAICILYFTLQNYYSSKAFSPLWMVALTLLTFRSPDMKL